MTGSPESGAHDTVLSRKERDKQTTKLTRHAVRRYGELKSRKARPALNQLILSVLYHQTSVRRATRALSELKRAFVDWNEVRVSHPAEVAAAVSSAAWALEAADCVVWLLKEVYELYNRTDLSFLSDLTTTQARS